MKKITNPRIEHILIDPDIQEHNPLPRGNYNVTMTDVVLRVEDGNPVLSCYYMITDKLHHEPRHAEEKRV